MFKNHVRNFLIFIEHAGSVSKEFPTEVLWGSLQADSAAKALPRAALLDVKSPERTAS